MSDEQKPELNKTIVLVGMMGAGKTAVGRSLARLLGVPFLDSDDEIERAATISIPEIFARDGEAFFRARESEVLARLVAGPPCVLSTGGGAWISERNRAVIDAAAVSVWLDADLDLLWARVKGRDTRPLLRTEDPRATLAALYEKRVPLYALARLRVSALPGVSIEQMTQRTADVLAAYAPAWKEVQ